MGALLGCLILVAAAEQEVGKNVYPLSVSGRALDADGRPIDGATVFMVSCSPDRTLGRITTAADGRGLSMGELWSRDGRLVATAAQEVVLRVIPTKDRTGIMSRGSEECGAMAPLAASAQDEGPHR